MPVSRRPIGYAYRLGRCGVTGRTFHWIALASLALLPASPIAQPQQESPRLYDHSAQQNINHFDFSPVGNNGTAEIAFPADWKAYSGTCIVNCNDGQLLAFRPLGANQFTEFYPASDLSKVSLGPAMHTRGAGKGTSLYIKFICPYGMCPTIRYTRTDDPGVANTAQPAAPPSPLSEFVSTALPVIGYVLILSLYALILFAIVRWFVRRKRRKKQQKEPTAPEPEVPLPTNITSIEDAIAAFSILNISPHPLMDVPQGGKTLLFLGLPEGHNSESNQNSIAEQIRKLLSEVSGKITPYQVPHNRIYEDAIRKNVSVFVGLMGIPSYFYGLQILPFDSIPLGIRQDSEGNELIIDTIPYSARTRHIYATGRSGSGKSTLLKTLALADIEHGKGIAIIDPHGDLAEDILGKISEDDVKRTIYISGDNAVPIDFMNYGNEREKEGLVGDIIFLLQRFPGWGPRMDAILRNVLYTLLEAGDTCFLDIYYFLTNPSRRNEILSRVKDQDLLRIWKDSFPRPDALEPIITRMTAFVRSPSFRTFLSGGQDQLDLYEVMQTGKILIVNLATAGRESGDLLGALIVSKLQQASMRRQAIPPNERRPFYVYTDEFQRFQTTAFENMLSETRKYEVGLVMANQFPDQLDPAILSSVIGNVSTLILFQLNPKDARHFVGGITMRPLREELVAKIKWDPESITINDLARAKRPVPPELLSDFPVGYALYRSADNQAHFTRITPNDSLHKNLGDQIKANTLAQYGMNRTDLSPSSNSPQVLHTEGNDKPDPEYGPAVPVDESQD